MKGIKKIIEENSSSKYGDYHTVIKNFDENGYLTSIEESVANSDYSKSTSTKFENGRKIITISESSNTSIGLAINTKKHIEKYEYFDSCIIVNCYLIEEDTRSHEEVYDDWFKSEMRAHSNSDDKNWIEYINSDNHSTNILNKNTLVSLKKIDLNNKEQIIKIKLDDFKNPKENYIKTFNEEINSYDLVTKTSKLLKGEILKKIGQLFSEEKIANDVFKVITEIKICWLLNDSDLFEVDDKIEITHSFYWKNNLQSQISYIAILDGYGGSKSHSLEIIDSLDNISLSNLTDFIIDLVDKDFLFTKKIKDYDGYDNSSAFKPYCLKEYSINKSEFKIEIKKQYFDEGDIIKNTGLFNDYEHLSYLPRKSNKTSKQVLYRNGEIETVIEIEYYV